MAEEQTKKIIEFLGRNKLKYKLIVHKAIYTSEEGARARGLELRSGVKSLIFKFGKDKFRLLLVRGDRKADLKKLREIFNVKNIRLASPEEVLRISGCEIGSVHPFGMLMNSGGVDGVDGLDGLDGLEIIMDESILENTDVDFSIGQHTHSAEMAARDFLKLLKPRIEEFTV